MKLNAYVFNIFNNFNMVFDTVTIYDVSAYNAHKKASIYIKQRYMNIKEDHYQIVGQYEC